MSPGSSSGTRSAMVLSTTAAGTISQTARGRASFFTKSGSYAAPVAFSCASASTAFGKASNTTQSWPPLMSRRTMFAPMRPRPIIPSCIARLLVRQLRAVERRFPSNVRCGTSQSGAPSPSPRPASCRTRAPRRAAPARALPQSEPALECVGVVALAAAGWEHLQLLHVAAAEHHLGRLERGGEPLDDVEHRAPPLLLPEPLEAAAADVILKGPLAVREMPQFERFDDAVDDERRAEASAEPEEEHLPAPVAAVRLHR